MHENVEIRVDIRIKTDVKYKRSDLFVHDKKRKEITQIEVDITNLDLLNQVENEKTRRHDLIASEIVLTYKCKVKIIPHLMTWERLDKKSHKKHRDETGIAHKTKA